MRVRVRVSANVVAVREAEALPGPAGVIHPYMQACDLLAALLDDDPEGGSSEEEGGMSTGR